MLSVNEYNSHSTTAFTLLHWKVIVLLRVPNLYPGDRIANRMVPPAVHHRKS